MTTAIIRNASPDDLDAVAALWQRLTSYHHDLDSRFWVHGKDGMSKFREWMSEALDDDGRIVIVAEADAQVVAFLHGMLKESPEVMARKVTGFVTDVFVSDHHRGHGVGTRLVEAANSWFARSGAEDVTLSVALCNRDGCKFWENVGFEPWTQTMWKSLQNQE